MILALIEFQVYALLNEVFAVLGELQAFLDLITKFFDENVSIFFLQLANKGKKLTEQLQLFFWLSFTTKNNRFKVCIDVEALIPHRFEDLKSF